MSNREHEKAFLTGFASKLNDEELQISIMQSLVAAEISMRRQERHMSQKDFSELMGVSQGMVSKWESGECNFTLSTLVSIALKLGIETRLPFVPAPAKIYTKGGCRVTSFPAANGWSSAVYSSSQDDFRTSVSDDELEEM